jgi:integrase
MQTYIDDLVKPYKQSSSVGERIVTRKAISANAHFRVLRALFNWAINIAEYISVSPFRGVQQLPTAIERKRVLNPEEFTKIIVVLRSNCPDHADAVECLLLSGMRRSELVERLEWEHIDWDTSEITLPETKARTKTGVIKSRTIYMTPEVFAILERRKGETHPFMAFDPRWKRRTRMSGESLSDVFRRAAEEAGISNVTLKDLRKTFGTMLARGGLERWWLMDAMGHANIETTNGYIGEASDKVRSAMDRLEKKMLKRDTTRRENITESNSSAPAEDTAESRQSRLENR